MSEDRGSEFEQGMAAGGRSALHHAAREARIRGDIGKPEGPEVWDFLNFWADKHYPEVDL